MDRGQVGGCCFGRLFLHAAGSIRAVEVVAGGRDLGVHIKAGGGIADVRRLNVVVADLIGHGLIGRGTVEPERIARVHAHGVAVNNKALAVGQLDRSTVRLTDGAGDRVVGEDEVRAGALEVHTAGIAVKGIVIQCHSPVDAGPGLERDGIAGVFGGIERAVLNGEVDVVIVIAVNTAVEGAAVKGIRRGLHLRRPRTGDGFDAIKRDAGKADLTVLNVLAPPVVGQRKRSTRGGKIQCSAVIAALYDDRRNVAVIAIVGRRTAKGKRMRILAFAARDQRLLAVDRPCDLGIVSIECIKRLLGAGLLTKSAKRGDLGVDLAVSVRHGGKCTMLITRNAFNGNAARNLICGDDRIGAVPVRQRKVTICHIRGRVAAERAAGDKAGEGVVFIEVCNRTGKAAAGYGDRIMLSFT